MEIKTTNLWVKQADCFDFLKEIPNASVDLILTDPPFGLNEKGFDQKHYNRFDHKVLKGYQEAPEELGYEDWVYSWVKEFDRILKSNGSVLIVSGWTNEADIQYAMRRTQKFKLINHLIWHYNFGVYTKTKFVSSHYHILYYAKTKGKPYFNKNAYHNEDHKNDRGGSKVYDDLQDVIKINKEYKPGQQKNSNALPLKLVEKLIKHTTRINDVVLDIFSGGFTTQFAALKLKRIAWGCEINQNSCEQFFPKLENFQSPYFTNEEIHGYEPSENLKNQGKPLNETEKIKIKEYFQSLSGTKKARLEQTAKFFQRGIWSIIRIVTES